MRGIKPARCQISLMVHVFHTWRQTLTEHSIASISCLNPPFAIRNRHQILEDDSDDEADDEEDGEKKLARTEKKEEERRYQVRFACCMMLFACLEANGKRYEEGATRQ